jgi:hypothetical protein
MKVGDLVTIINQNWTNDTPFLVLGKSWIKGEWIIWSAKTGKLQWRGRRLKVVSEAP